MLIYGPAEMLKVLGSIMDPRSGEGQAKSLVIAGLDVQCPLVMLELRCDDQSYCKTGIGALGLSNPDQPGCRATQLAQSAFLFIVELVLLHQMVQQLLVSLQRPALCLDHAMSRAVIRCLAWPLVGLHPRDGEPCLVVRMLVGGLIKGVPG